MYKSHLLIILMFVINLFGHTNKCMASDPVAIKINSTFMQPLNIHYDWQEKDWHKLFGSFQELQLNTLILQWVRHDTSILYKARSDDKPNNVLETIMYFADQYNIKVKVGLYYDPDYWKFIKDNADVRKIYMNKLLQKQIDVSEEVYQMVKNYDAFIGWYITDEIDDENWTKKDNQEILIQYLSRLNEHLLKLTPNKTVSISGFTNYILDPKSIEEFWSKLLNSSKINNLYFQDGIGAKKTNLSTLPIYLTSIKQACDSNGANFIPVVELYDVQSHYDFQAVPANFDRIEKQLVVASQISPDQIAVFSVPSYMNSFTSKQTNNLFNEFKSKYINPD